MNMISLVEAADVDKSLRLNDEEQKECSNLSIYFVT